MVAKSKAEGGDKKDKKDEKKKDHFHFPFLGKKKKEGKGEDSKNKKEEKKVEEEESAKIASLRHKEFSKEGGKSSVNARMLISCPPFT